MPSTPTTPKCDSSSTTEDSPDDDTPDEILCQAAENPVAQTSEWTTHQGQGCAYLTKKGETKCNERHVVNGDTGEKVWCEWVNDECRTGGSCDVAADSPITPPDEGISAEAGKVLMTNYLNSSSIKDVAKAKYQASAPMGGNPSDWVDAWTSWRNGMVNAYLSYRGDDKTKVSTCTALPEADCNNSYVQTKGEYNMADYYSAYDQAWRYGAHKRDNVSKCKWVAED